METTNSQPAVYFPYHWTNGISSFNVLENLQPNSNEEIYNVTPVIDDLNQNILPFQLYKNYSEITKSAIMQLQILRRKIQNICYIVLLQNLQKASFQKILCDSHILHYTLCQVHLEKQNYEEYLVTDARLSVVSNIHFCTNGSYISQKYLCDGKVDCAGMK